MPALVTLVVPVKGGVTSKSRLGAGPDLAAAIALDTVEAARAAGGVGQLIVVGSLAEALPGVQVVTDPGYGLIAAIGAGLALADPALPTAVLLGDLPALRPEDLEAALIAASEHHWAFVPDAAGEGTTLVVASAGLPHSLRFGHDSAEQHRVAGYVDLTAGDAGPALRLDTLRRDVDTADDLVAARALGLGPRTGALG